MKTKDLFKQIENLKLTKLCKLIQLIETKYKTKEDTKAIQKSNTQQTEISIYLTECGNNKIQVIKILKEILNISLMEAKKITDKLPQLITTVKTQAEFNKIKTQLETVGASIKDKIK